MRSNIVRWVVSGVQRHLEQRCLRVFHTLKIWCAPRVMAAYFRTLWNGWPTDRRMDNLRRTSGLKNRGCALNCGWDNDALEHYATCKVFWTFATKPVPQGLGIDDSVRSKKAFFLLDERLGEIGQVKMALGIYALQRVVMHCRQNMLSTQNKTSSGKTCYHPEQNKSR